MNQKFPSKYSNGKEVSPAQYVAEIVCERIAKKQNKDLHYRFWLNDDWAKEYKGQLAASYKLLKKYDVKAIIKALQSAGGLKIYSLRAPHLVAMIDREQKILDSKPEPTIKKIDRNFLDKGKTEIKPTNILDKLRDLDGGTTR
jgi:hypothetical protein